MPWRSMGRMGSLRSASCARAAVVALGNPYRGDDGVGPALLRLLRLDGLWGVGDGDEPKGSLSVTDRSAPVDLIEAVYDGFRLAETICGYKRVLVVDAARWLAPGEVRRVSLDDLPSRADWLHGFGFRAALEALASAGEETPRVEILAIGAPGDPPFGEGLSPQVERALPKALAEVKEWLNGC